MKKLKNAISKLYTQRDPRNVSNWIIKHSHDTPNNLILFGFIFSKLKISKDHQDNGIKEENWLGVYTLYFLSSYFNSINYNTLNSKKKTVVLGHKIFVSNKLVIKSFHLSNSTYLRQHYAISGFAWTQVDIQGLPYILERFSSLLGFCHLNKANLK